MLQRRRGNPYFQTLFLTYFRGFPEDLLSSYSGATFFFSGIAGPLTSYRLEMGPKLRMASEMAGGTRQGQKGLAKPDGTWPFSVCQAICPTIFGPLQDPSCLHSCNKRTGPTCRGSDKIALNR